MSGGKVSKASVRYRPARIGGSRIRKCGTCSMFRAPESCTLVAGRIRRQDVCDRWVAK